MTYLDRIVPRKQIEVEAAKSAKPLADLQDIVATLGAPLSFVQKLADNEAPAIIAELKRASPSKGAIRPDLDAIETVVSYVENGAACLSILTDSDFEGSLDDISKSRDAVRATPILRKDFIIDEYQIWETRAVGADCVLLIASVLDDVQLSSYLDLCLDLGLSILIETHTVSELERVIPLISGLDEAGRGFVSVGVNNRDLTSMEVDCNRGRNCFRWLSERGVIEAYPSVSFVIESGISMVDELREFYELGSTGFLLGYSLVREGNPGENLRSLLGEFRSG